MADRVPFLQAHDAGRVAIDKAVHAEVTPRQLRVLLAVLHVTVLWSQLSDRQSLAQLARLAGIGGTDTRKVEKRVADDLRHLASLGIVTYLPGGGRHRMSVIGIPPTEKGPDTGAGNDEEKGPDTGPKGAPAPGQKGPPPRGRTQGVPQGTHNSRGGRRPPSFGDGSAWADHPGGKVDL